MRRVPRWRALAAVMAASALITACGGGDDADGTNQEASDESTATDGSDGESTGAAADEGAGGDGAAAGSEIDDLVAAAQGEGGLVWYSVPSEEIAEAVSSAFGDEYGIEVEFQRLASSDLAQRYSAEADAGTTVADAVLVSNTPFVPEALESGWTVALADAGIPGYPGDYPEEFVLDDRGTAIVSIEPSGIAYNTDEVPEGEAPTTWADLADPAWEGKILLIDPAASPAYIDFWSVVLDAEGPEVLEGIAANAAQAYYPSGVPAVEALAAGEGAVVVPGAGAIVAGAADRGAPVAYVQPELTTGPEIVALVSEAAPHPAAARLFVWWILYGEGQDILNSLPTTASPATGEDLPAGYTQVAPGAQSKGPEILDLLGLG